MLRVNNLRPVEGSTDEFTLYVLLKSVGQAVRVNSNGTEYRWATVSYELIDDETGEIHVVESSAMVYEKNFAKNMKVGEVYLTNAQRAGDQVYLSVSALPRIQQPSADHFQVVGAEAPKVQLDGTKA